MKSFKERAERANEYIKRCTEAPGISQDTLSDCLQEFYLEVYEESYAKGFACGWDLGIDYCYKTTVETTGLDKELKSGEEMANRCTLHKSKLEDFKQYLIDQNIAFRPGKGPYQVLQVMTEKGFKCVYERNDMPEHLTVQDDLVPTVFEFIRLAKDGNKTESKDND